MESREIRSSDLMRTSKKPIELVVLDVFFGLLSGGGVSLCIKPKKKRMIAYEWSTKTWDNTYNIWWVTKKLTMHLEHEANLSTANISLYRTMQLHPALSCQCNMWSKHASVLKQSDLLGGWAFLLEPMGKKNNNLQPPHGNPNSPGGWSSKRSCESGSSSIPSKMPETHWLPEQFCNSAKLKLTWAPTFQGSNLPKETEEKRGWMNGLLEYHLF